MPESSRSAAWSLLAVVVAAVLFCHLWQLADLPRGIYLDEVSIGFNAMTMAEHGVDEHHVAFPVYFEAFGEYKNPLYVYATAALFKVFGPSATALRLTSALWFLAALALFGVLLARLFPGDRVLMLYGVLGLGFMPHYFNLARVSFEAISELPFVVAALLAVHACYEAPARHHLAACVAVGSIVGLSVFSYSTNRMFSPLLFAAIVLLYYRRDRVVDLAIMSGAFVLLQVPLVVFMLVHPGALTKRFDSLTYLSNPSLNALGKVLMFLRQYFIHLGPKFLLFVGDGTLRHTSGLGGVVFWTVLAMVPFGLVAFARTPAQRSSPFVRLVLAGLLLTPLPAALTKDPGGHTLRTLPLSFFLLLVSCYGLAALRTWAGKRSAVMIGIVLGMLATEAVVYTWYYFTIYPERSIAVFDGAGFPECLEAAFARHPREVRYMQKRHFPVTYAYIEFWRRILHLPDSPPFVPYDKDEAVPGTCAVYFLTPPQTPPGVHVSYEIDRPDFFVHLRCYE